MSSLSSVPQRKQYHESLPNAFFEEIEVKNFNVEGLGSFAADLLIDVEDLDSFDADLMSAVKGLDFFAATSWR